MHIQPIASALSKSFTNSYFPLKNVGNSRNNEPCTLESSSIINIEDPFQLFIPTSNKIHQFKSLINSLNPTSFISTYSDGILLNNPNSIHSSCIFSYNYGNLQQNKTIELPLITSKIIFMEIINDKLFILTNANFLYIVNPLSGFILDSKKLSYNFTSIKQVVSLTPNSILTLFLYTNGSYCQLISIDFKFSISFKTSLIYLDFWAISILSISNSLFYIFGSSGLYQILIFKSLDDYSLSSSSSNRNLNLIDKKYGKLIDIRILNNNIKTFIFIQEKGWITYQFCTKFKNINASLNNLLLMISSPLSSNFERMVQINEKSFILMNNRSLILISNNNIYPIDSINNCKLLDIWLDSKNNRLLGLFDLIDFNKQINYLDVNTLSWNSFNPTCTEIPFSSTIYQDETFEILNNEHNRLFLKNRNSNHELCTLFNFNTNHIKIIDLNLVVNLSDSFKYYIILDLIGNCQLFVFKNDISKILKTFNPLKKIINISYYEDDGILLLKDNENRSIYINVLNFEILSKFKLKSKLNFQIYTLNDQLKQFDNDYFIDIDIISFNELLKYNYILSENSWFGIKTNQQSIFFEFNSDLLVQSPEIFLTYTILNKNIDLNIISKITKLDSHCILMYIYKIANFCLSNNSLIIEHSINLLYTLLSKNPQIIDLLFDTCSKNDVNLVDTILMTFCISISHKQLSYSIDKMLRNILNYMLVLNYKICEICIDALKKLEIKDYKITSGYVNTAKHHDFDLIMFFSELFRIRSLFFNDAKRRNFKSFEQCTEFFNHVIQKELFDGFVIMSTIIENPQFELENKRAVIDYINYLIIEKNEVIEKNENCTLILFILINSTFSLLMTISNYDIHSIDEFWETVSLLLNLLSSKFRNLFTISYNQNNWKDIIQNKKELSACLVLNQLGYYGVMYIKNLNNEWSLIPLKSSESILPNLDPDNQSINKIDDEKIKNIFVSGRNHNLMIKNPLVFPKINKVAIINMNRLSIQVWNFNYGTNNELFRDNITIEILKDNLIPLKVPDFNLILLQLLWGKLNFTSTESHEIKISVFTALVQEFQQQISSPFLSPKLSSTTPNSGLWVSDGHYLNTQGALVAEPYGEYSFALLLQEYLNVFPHLNNNSVSIEEESGQIALTLEGKPVFVWMLT